MKVLRTVVLASLLVAVQLGTASAQRITEPGTYSVKIGVATDLLPPGTLPPGFPSIGPEVYEGTLTVRQGADGTYRLTFRSDPTDGTRLMAMATFSSEWTGFQLGTIVVGTETVTDALVSIDGAHLLDARIQGVGTVEGTTQRIQINLGAGGTVEDFRILGGGPPDQSGNRGVRP